MFADAYGETAGERRTPRDLSTGSHCAYFNVAIRKLMKPFISHSSLFPLSNISQLNVSYLN